jgi:hypothetical protein
MKNDSRDVVMIHPKLDMTALLSAFVIPNLFRDSLESSKKCGAADAEINLA